MQKIYLNKTNYVFFIYCIEDISRKREKKKKSTPSDLQRIKRHVGATATQTFVSVTTHINHSGLFGAAQKLGTMAGKQR